MRKTRIFILISLAFAAARSGAQESPLAGAAQEGLKQAVLHRTSTLKARLAQAQGRYRALSGDFGEDFTESILSVLETTEYVPGFVKPAAVLEGVKKHLSRAEARALDLDISAAKDDLASARKLLDYVSIYMGKYKKGGSRKGVLAQIAQFARTKVLPAQARYLRLADYYAEPFKTIEVTVHLKTGGTSFFMEDLPSEIGRDVRIALQYARQGAIDQARLRLESAKAELKALNQAMDSYEDFRRPHP
ncbi:MAG: hypothetical protein HY921_12645 [Elusimicrobia bacterium]|nr:hypothetical protein [Elusimicrobiota bacterium]